MNERERNEDKKKNGGPLSDREWKRRIRERDQLLRGDRDYFTYEIKGTLRALSEAMEEERDPRSVLKMILLDLAFYFPEWITRDREKEEEITLGKRPMNIYVKELDYYEKLIEDLIRAVGVVYAAASAEKPPEYQPGLEEIMQRLSEAFPLYLEKEEIEGKITIRLKR